MIFNFSRTSSNYEPERSEETREPEDEEASQHETTQLPESESEDGEPPQKKRRKRLSDVDTAIMAYLQSPPTNDEEAHFGEGRWLAQLYFSL